MLKKSDKFILRKERQFFSSAFRVHQKHFSIFWKDNQSKLLLLVIIARGVAQNSVERNMIKRTVYSTLSSIMKTHKERTKSAVVIIKNKKSLEQLAELEDQIQLIITT